MVEGDSVFKEAIQFLNSLPPLQPLQWDDNLAKSALSHVNDIGPKGLLLYQSSDGTEPEDRISKFGHYTDSLGENIDFGPNDAMGVLVSLTLDDGEEERPHRENLFKDDYHKVGIACGPHSTEFQMCVMDFAFDFQPLEGNNNNINDGNNEINEQFENDNRNIDKKNVNQSPIVKLSLKEDEDKQKEMNNANNINANINNRGYNDIDQLTQDTVNLMNSLKVISKKVEIDTTITYTYEDGSTKVVTQKQCHEFKQ